MKKTSDSGFVPKCAATQRATEKRAPLSRRHFLGMVGSSACLGAYASCLPHTQGDWSSCNPETFQLDQSLVPRSNRVVQVSSERVALDGKIEATVAREMFEAGLLALTQAENLSQAWQTVIPTFQTGERISLKANTLSQDVPTSAEVLAAITKTLVTDWGVAQQDVFIWDRAEKELQLAGIVPEVVGVACRGTYFSYQDTQGVGYEQESVCLSGRKIHLSRLLTREQEHLINVAVMKNHFVAGFTGCLKNHYGSFDIPHEFHIDCEKHIALLNAMPQVSGTSRLFVLDAIYGVCQRDTNATSFDCIPKRILLSFDPVAIDACGLQIRDEMRAQKGDGPGLGAGYLQQAENLGLGSTQFELVSLVV